MAQVQNRSSEIVHHAVKGNSDAGIKINLAAGLLLQINEKGDHTKALDLLSGLHRVQLLEIRHVVLAEGFVLIGAELKVIREVGLLGKFDAVLRQVRETTQCAHGDLILILVGLLPVIVGRRAEGQDYLAVALSSERTGFQQRLGIEETARIGVLARLDIIQRIPAKIQGLPEFVREEVFGIVPDPLLQGFNVHLRIPPLDDSGPANRLRRANIVLAE
mmetsp:Transcript_16638/g.47748  ORF Transcript_16638/g.47748 Transcript_16638/m.47748 type:complete len:218 (+) Transcript_16638:1402-2055(+)